MKGIAKQLGRTAVQWNEQGLIHLQDAQYQLAFNEFDFAIQHSKADYYRRGIVYAKLNQFQNALADFDHALQLDPNYNDARMIREATYQAMKRSE